ncbi:cupin domain-containing protein [Paraburkholderia sp.]|jgi:oxalate decarboxylase/phosphoglucose isomerase-like protein (cupin superfamily)|uniref:cupin domain-containing protein n=1 Tax=Paraburkholderia sp. TaxID=1926495 RepID=UPI002F400C19
MDPRLDALSTDPSNQIFGVLFFPDRIYHQAYLNATRSPRYRYNVTDVRSYYEVMCLKGSVFLDGAFYANFVRIEYRGSRLTEAMRVRNRFLRSRCAAWLKLTDKSGRSAQTDDDHPLTLHYDAWVNAFQAEIWDRLEQPDNARHDASVLALMGRDNEITRITQFLPLLNDVTSIAKAELAFREESRQYAFGNLIQKDDLAWDNDFGRTHQQPVRPDVPSADENTVHDMNYLLDFQRGWFKQASDVTPVLYRNAMMLGQNGVYTNPDASSNNIIQMRWLFQRELGGSMIFFHEVTIPPGKVEGNHQHVGSEELYYIVQGNGIAYLRVGDDPTLGDQYNTVQREVFGLGQQDFKELPVKAGSIIYTKSGGMHGIRNLPDSPVDLKFVAFLYHSA